MKTFENKTVLITGGTSGIGKAAALAFAKEGANVVVSGRRVAEGEEVSREITSAGGSALFVRADVSREDDIVALVEKTVRAFGALHIAFNNAGIEGKFGLLTTEQTVEHYDQVCDINIRGVLLSMKHEIPAMLRSGGGAIVNNSSIGGHIGFNGSSVYVASKFAVIGLTKTAALEFAKQGVRVNSVSPGTVQTPRSSCVKRGRPLECLYLVAAKNDEALAQIVHRFPPCRETPKWRNNGAFRRTTPLFATVYEPYVYRLQARIH
jgi:NAD(P)-dependent dehydrogenase (short-subunit alcohol dehydrogenase family)